MLSNEPIVFVCLYGLELRAPGSTPATSLFFFATEGAGSTPAQASSFFFRNTQARQCFVFCHFSYCLMYHAGLKYAKNLNYEQNYAR